jgi:hypothetical protein
MDTLEFVVDQKAFQARVDIDGFQKPLSLWGVPVNKEYEKGWSSRLDSDTPSLFSNSSVWYFEAESDEIGDEMPLELTEECADPMVSIIPSSIAI